MRTKKIVGDLTYNYYWQGSKLVAMTLENSSGVVTATYKFYYDSNGLPFIFDYNGTIYYYVTNLQGDVVGLADEYGISARYTYDAWGNIIRMDAATNAPYYAMVANPLRYRGYIYDSETGFYYLQSRYYDPEVGRFLNADGQLTLSNSAQINLYKYCCNNPVMYYDPSGNAADTVLDIISLVFGVGELIANPYDIWNWIGLVGDVADIAVPFLTCVGETIRTLKAGQKVVKTLDNVEEIQKYIKTTCNVITLAANSFGQGNNSVYVSFYENGMIEYVGITNCFGRRKTEWDGTRKIYEVGHDLSRDGARYVEQTIISIFGKTSEGSVLSNIRNSIGRNGKLSSGYVDFIKKLFKNF